ncbi:MAG: guanylate kinase [Thermoguttaceae bacterium]|nr:guanylate kinase [Thermoguttaceae bacterium]
MSSPAPSAGIPPRGKLIIISGPSGVGKGTLVSRVRQSGEFPLAMSISATTREKRPGEQDGVDYHFLSRDEFLARQNRGEFLESFEVYPGGALYGTLKAPVLAELEKGNWVILEIDVKGAEEALKSFPDALTVFIEPPGLDVLEARLRGRGTETEESLAKRLAQAQSEIEKAGQYKYRVVNDRLEQAVADLTAILRKG